MSQILRCSVCGHVLGRSESEKNRFGKLYCPPEERPCLLYPSLAQAKQEDLTLGPYIMVVLETSNVSAYALGRALGRSGSVQNVYEKQQQRWRDFE